MRIRYLIFLFLLSAPLLDGTVAVEESYIEISAIIPETTYHGPGWVVIKLSVVLMCIVLLARWDNEVLDHTPRSLSRYSQMIPYGNY